MLIIWHHHENFSHVWRRYMHEKEIWTQKYLFNSNLDFNGKDIWTQSLIKGLPHTKLNALYNLEVYFQKKRIGQR